MAHKSRRRKKRNKFEFGPSTDETSAPVLTATDLTDHFSGGAVSISLKYYSSSCECFSMWGKRELKKLTGTIDKISQYSSEQLKSTKSLCDIHKGNPSERRFSIPETISIEISIYEIKVDPSNKLRVHGFFVRDIFFLLWLDRKHACFKQ